MSAIEKVKQVQQILGVTADGAPGPLTEATWLQLKADAAKERAPSGKVLKGDGTWPWAATIDWGDIVVMNARATCFGGANDPQDSGETASGISTKENPNLAAVSLPMDFGDKVKNTKGSPIPKVPWKTMVRVFAMGQVHDFPVIDIGPAKRTGNGIDLTIAAARMFKPTATATNFEMHCDYRIIGGAVFAV